MKGKQKKCLTDIKALTQHIKKVEALINGDAVNPDQWEQLEQSFNKSFVEPLKPPEIDI